MMMMVKNIPNNVDDLAVPAIRSLGIHSRDFARFEVPTEAMLPLTEADRARGMALLQRPWMGEQVAWRREIQRMLWMDRKAEIQAMTMYDCRELVETYLPVKLADESLWL